MLQKYNCCIVKNAKKNVPIDFFATCGKMYSEVEGFRMKILFDARKHKRKGGFPQGKEKL